MEDLPQRFGEGHGFQHVVQRRQAGRQLVVRQGLQPHLAAGGEDTAQAAEQDQHRVDAPSALRRVVQGGEQGKRAADDEEDALDDAQRARFETHHVLQIEAAAHQDDAGEEGEEEQGTRAGQVHGSSAAGREEAAKPATVEESPRPFQGSGLD
ncbi:hypothetical protein D9M72_581330 [compost metagenome]